MSDHPEFCKDCMSKWGQYLSQKHPPQSMPTPDCCGQPDDCAEFLSGKCSPAVEET